MVTWLMLGQGAVLHGVVVDGGGLSQILLHEGIEELCQNGTLGGNWGQFHMLLLCGTPVWRIDIFYPHSPGWAGLACASTSFSAASMVWLRISSREPVK